MSFASTPVRKKLAIVAAVVGTVVSFVAIGSLIGHPARLVDLIGLFATAFAAGAGLVVAIQHKA